MMTLIYFILILGIIVLVHEFGHFIFAKMFGVHVYEFSIGMGPKIWGTKPKKGKTAYNIRAVPIGGFVQLAGEEVDDDSSIPKDKKLYNKPIWQRFLIMFFGAGNNFILAFILLFLIGLFTGSPNMDPVVNKVDPAYPMYEAGIRDNDKIVSINGKKVSTIDDVQVYMTLAAKGETVDFVIERNGKEQKYEVTPKKEEADGVVTYKFGITFEQQKEKGFLNALKYAFIKIGALIKQMFIVLGSLFTGKLGLNSLSGPVGIYSIVGETAEAGFTNILNLIALLSVNVGFLNLIPFPAFDGGRLLFLIIEKIKGSKVSPKVENAIHSVGFILILLLLIFITFNDIINLF